MAFGFNAREKNPMVCEGGEQKKVTGLCHWARLCQALWPLSKQCSDLVTVKLIPELYRHLQADPDYQLILQRGWIQGSAQTPPPVLHHHLWPLAPAWKKEQSAGPPSTPEHQNPCKRFRSVSGKTVLQFLFTFALFFILLVRLYLSVWITIDLL